MQKQIKIGDSVYVVSSDDDYLIAMGNDFEPHMVQLFRALIGLDDVVADIGANIGLTAILFSTLANKVYAFEPSSSTFQILFENLDRNAISNVEAINIGIGEKEEAQTITFAQNNRSGGFVSDKIRLETGHITEEIRLDTIDHFFASKEPSPTFLKIDVEGFEVSVIRGGSAFLQRARPVVVMEMNHFCLDVLHRITIPDFLDFMRSVFPYLYAVDNDNTTIFDLHVPDEAYMVMHEHVVKNRFPNLVGGYDLGLKEKLKKLERVAKQKGKIIARTYDASVNAGSVFDFGVYVVNESKEIWYGYGQNPVYLSYHWTATNGDLIIFDGIRTKLMKPELSPGDFVEQQTSIKSPSVPGKYRLVLTMVQEGVCWLEEKGFEPAVLNIEVL